MEQENTFLALMLDSQHNESATSPSLRDLLVKKGYMRKVGVFWILMKQKMMGWHWHHPDHMHIICTSLQTDKHDKLITMVVCIKNENLNCTIEFTCNVNY